MITNEFFNYVKELPKLEGGLTANLKIDDPNFRLWDDRVDGSIILECLVNGRWITIAKWEL